MSKAIVNPRKALGRGLSALLPARTPSTEIVPGLSPMPGRLPIHAILPNPMQPRSVFQADRLEELAASMRANGIIQPLIVRKHGDAFQIVAGERRWRAAKIAGITEVPVVIREVPDRQMLELALIENLQREDLNPMEAAHAFDRLNRHFDLSQEEIGKRTGKDRASITNTLRLLKLPQEVQVLIAAQRLSVGHAKAILGLPEAEMQIQVGEKCAAQGMSVRQVETLVQELTSNREKTGGTKRESTKNPDPNVKAAIEALERTLGTRVRIVELSEQRGRIEIEYYSQAELERLFLIINEES